MKVDSTRKCLFCGAPATDPKHNEVLEIHRLCKRPQKSDRIDKTSITLPTCTACYKDHHPFYKIEYKLPVYLGAIAAVCVLISFIQKAVFSTYTGLGLILLIVFCIGGAFFFTWCGFLLTTVFFEDAFKPSVKVKPYSDLEAVKYIKHNGFIDADDDNYIAVNTDDVDYVPVQTVREELLDKFGCYKTP